MPAGIVPRVVGAISGDRRPGALVFHEDTVALARRWRLHANLPHLDVAVVLETRPVIVVWRLVRVVHDLTGDVDLQVAIAVVRAVKRIELTPPTEVGDVRRGVSAIRDARPSATPVPHAESIDSAVASGRSDGH